MRSLEKIESLYKHEQEVSLWYTISGTFKILLVFVIVCVVV